MSLLCARAAAASRESTRTGLQPAFDRSTLVSRVTSSAMARSAGAELGEGEVPVGAGVVGGAAGVVLLGRAGGAGARDRLVVGAGVVGRAVLGLGNTGPSAGSGAPRPSREPGS